MSTEVLEKPDLKDRNTSPDMFHYVHKDKILSSVVDGYLVRALCGEVFSVTKTPKPGSPVCPECEEIYRQMKS